MNRPSVIARFPEEARLVLEEAGLAVAAVACTAPPGGGPGGPRRVVRERWAPQGVELVVAASVGLAQGEDRHG